MRKKVYMVVTTELVHHAHIELISKAAKLGELIVGVYSDEVLVSLGRIPIMRQEERMEIFKSIKGVSRVVAQNELDYTNNLKTLKPDVVVHGDNWKTSGMKHVRLQTINVLKEWGGELVEFPFTHDVPADEVIKRISRYGFLPEVRRRKLNYFINNKPIVRIIEAHNGITGLIAERAKVVVDGKTRSFDGMWISSLCDSTAKGKPDIELVDHSSRLQTVQEIMEVTTKPIILDGDSGGLIEHFVYNLMSIERSGVSAIIIEDKIGLKKNSLLGDAGQSQDSIEDFCKKLAAGKSVLSSKDFSIIARVESLILKKGCNDALTRARAYIDAGADGIMIHSNQKKPDEILDFCDGYVKFGKVPLIVVPTSYNTVTESELVQHGANIVIYANHLLRSAFPAMMKTAETILQNGRAYEADKDCMSIEEILTLIPQIKYEET